jgi:2-iminoacetate synthase ThiH
MTTPSEQETREYVERVPWEERIRRVEQEQALRGKQVDDLMKLADEARRWWLDRRTGVWQDPPEEHR